MAINETTSLESTFVAKAALNLDTPVYSALACRAAVYYLDNDNNTALLEARYQLRAALRVLYDQHE